MTPDTDASLPQGNGPLAGFVILDLTRVLSGPYCTMILQDLGATVLKVEQPEVGDDSRQFLPFEGDRSAYFALANRGKKSIALDLKAPKDRRVFEALLAKADVLVENFRPGVMEKLGYDWEAIRARNGRLVFASISGFGQSGPYRKKPAYDLVVQAMSGMMSLTGHPGQPPARVGTSLGDLAAGVFAALGIQSALLQRSTTGKGARVDISMLECQMALLENAISRFTLTGTSPGPTGAAHPGSAPFDAFRAQDGYLVITAGTDKLFKTFCGVIDRSDLLEDPRFADRASRVANNAALKEMIEDKLAAAPVAEWLSRLDAASIPAARVNSIKDMVNDPQVKARGAIAPLDGSQLKLACTPVLVDAETYPDRLPAAPELDEHHAEILAFAGL
ncbi:CaiB/BaiF CoA transferase family protein [Paracoccus saliphilus]|uniref:CoA transferase n=1 Tax=Paracoccus saliphilus TaxID=405559 RepID=A0AA45W688_9RHOB|nr:CaiB/BaiF CoA-transferase family protein [Paracoccus saliphilus]WCR01531.1 CoA transferase [Paracoccus saliphilus]SIS99192.1 CoA:oxalate CoA-transferase [Paracoccus saliphilus]